MISESDGLAEQQHGAAPGIWFRAEDEKVVDGAGLPVSHLGAGAFQREGATRSAGVIASSTTRKAMLSDSSRVTRSAGSVVVPPGRPVIGSACSGSGSGIHSPT